MNLKFEPLSHENFDEAIALGSSVFPYDKDHVRTSYERILDPDKKYFEERRLLEYFVVKDSETNKIVALTGLYNMKKQPQDEAWLGWFCVDQEIRGRGIGRQILEWTINRAKELGYKKFKLYTSTDPNESAAQNLYESVGLKIYKREPSKEFAEEEILYRQMDL